jgi:hypothetical protein
MTEQTGKTISAEQTVKRAETMNVVFLAFLLTLPLIGMLFGFIFASATAGRIFARSGQVGKDLIVAVITTAAGALAMVLAWLWMFKGAGFFALILDFGFNFWILRWIVLGTLRHVWD